MATEVGQVQPTPSLADTEQWLHVFPPINTPRELQFY